MSQKTDILKYMKKGGKLTALKALRVFDCYRLASRIGEIEKLGIFVPRKTVKRNNGKRYTEYWID